VENLEIELIKKLIDSSSTKHNDFIKKAKVAERYYKNENDILYNNNSNRTELTNALRNADNRVPFAWHELLVNQKAGYMFTYPPTFDVGNDSLNEQIAETLGEKYPKVVKGLCIDASNTGTAWLHIWADENNNFRYGKVDPKQITPIYSDDLDQELVAALRQYTKLDDKAKEFTVYEYWTDSECYAYSSLGTTSSLSAFDMFGEGIGVYKHDLGMVPFIEFPNNEFKSSDLDKIKKLIDVYDKTYSGFANDVEDIQEIIFVLTNFGGTDLKEILGNLKRYKAVDLQSSGDDKSGLSTLSIDIPVEARDKLLELTEKAIYFQGQGINPDPSNFGNASGVALKYLYSLLELKAGLMETEFRLAFGKLIRAICDHFGNTPDKIIQTWTRNMISNDLETADIAVKAQGVISDETIIKNHPWVDDPQSEFEALSKQKQLEAQRQSEVFGFKVGE
jgi:SPP1 family phage portal protein